LRAILIQDFINNEFGSATQYAAASPARELIGPNEAPFRLYSLPSFSDVRNPLMALELPTFAGLGEGQSAVLSIASR
jgi:hypothetical protein